MYDFLRVDKNPMDSITPRENELPESQKFDLNQLGKIVDCLSKDYYYSLLEKFEFPERPDREKQFQSMSKKAISSLEVLLEQLQQKLRVQFSNNQEAFRFFDITQTQKCKKEHFVFNCAYFQLDHEISEVIELFDILDQNGDGVLDSTEFDLLFQGVKDSWNSHAHDITASVLRTGMLAGRNVDISQAYNTLDKFGPDHKDMHGYPHFFGKTL